MNISVCKKCGVAFRYEGRGNNRLYCPKCQAANVSAMHPCQYNEFVDCTRKVCGECGWVPEVAQRRLLEVMARMGSGNSGGGKNNGC